MIDRYSRTCRIDAGAELGIVRGVLATDGEASDGHILNMKGGHADPGAPLLFGHDAHSGRANLGSWLAFQRGEHELRGTAQIELGGIGAQADWRADLAHMIQQGHVGALSVRWDPIDPPIRRVNLPSDHPAYVNAETAKSDDPRRWGLFFGSWRVVEGSVVTVGADPHALIGRVAHARGADRDLWRGALAGYFADGAADATLRGAYAGFRQTVEFLRECGVTDFGTLLRLCGCNTDASQLVAVEYGDGQRLLIPREAHDRLTGSARERLELAFDLLADVVPAAVDLVELEATRAAPEVPAPAPARQEPEPTVGSTLPDELRDLLEALRLEAKRAAREDAAALRF